MAERANQARDDFLRTWSEHLSRALDPLRARIETSPTDPASASIGQSLDRVAELMDALSDRLGIAPVATNRRPRRTLTPVADEPQPQRRRLLVIDDNAANQALLRIQLETLGFAVDVAADGAGALLKWQNGGYALILTDRQMPGMDGLALTRSIRAAEADSGDRIPIIGITASQQPEDLDACRACGMPGTGDAQAQVLGAHGRHPVLRRSGRASGRKHLESPDGSYVISARRTRTGTRRRGDGRASSRYAAGTEFGAVGPGGILHTGSAAAGAGGR